MRPASYERPKPERTWSRGAELGNDRLTLIVTLVVFGILIPLEQGTNWSQPPLILLLAAMARFQRIRLILD